ncbi:CPBP family intramembrane glutamic endopeptidase [Nocardia flavorosea]|uniref:CPBP family intramembrane metalloprotease n=1 Tax=Nocardia flavorosea TaxID=53429 RepID=A0A846YR04_9NOCA|nr:type II CAAX endopeptidase family protein [Nocardia flavorosea]NKY60131.1 CPBP family intramembrane metalloprotease [Nocardia flavorosea]
MSSARGESRARVAAGVPNGPGIGRVAIMVVGFAVVMLVSNSIASSVRHPMAAVLVGPVLACVVIWLYIWAGRRIERRRVVEFPRRGGGLHLVVGTVAGIGLAAVAIGFLALAGVYRISGWGSVFGAFAVAGTMCAIAVAEEVFFRGIVFRLLWGRWGTVVALVVSAVLFGLVHLINPDASVWGAIAIAVEAGLLLGAAYLATGSLWLAIGLHFGWNAATVGIFGTVTSGSEARESLVTAVTAGPDWLSGGSFGPEASVVSVLVCSAATVLLLSIGHRRGLLPARNS